MSRYIKRDHDEVWGTTATQINALDASGAVWDYNAVLDNHSIPDGWYEDIVAECEYQLPHMAGWFVPPEQLADELTRLERLVEAETDA